MTSFRTLGRSGLVVSPFALGTMTFGAGRWGAEEDGAHAIVDAYAEAGGNFVDTADIYGGGRSEEMLGRWVAERGVRDRVVIATKFTWNVDSGNPNAGGSGRKNVLRAVDASLRRLGTDYIDLYWWHFWDMTTPVEELLQTLTDLVRSGKIRWSNARRSTSTFPRRRSAAWGSCPGARLPAASSPANTGATTNARVTSG